MNAVSEVKDLTGMTEAVLTQAIEYCTQKVRLDNSQAVIDRLREGDGQVCEYYNYSLAKQVAASLARWMKTLRQPTSMIMMPRLRALTLESWAEGCRFI